MTYGPETASTTALPNTQLVVDSCMYGPTLVVLCSHSLNFPALLVSIECRPLSVLMLELSQHTAFPWTSTPQEIYHALAFLIILNRNDSRLHPHSRSYRVQFALQPTHIRLQRDWRLLRQLYGCPTAIRCCDRRREFHTQSTQSCRERWGARFVRQRHSRCGRPPQLTEHTGRRFSEECAGGL